MHKQQSGFTLVELMIVVAIIAILAAIAIPAYNEYIKESKMAKVTNHYDEAVRSVRSHAAKIAAIDARGGTETLPSGAAGWISVIDPDGKSQAPEGGVAGFNTTQDDANGVILIGTTTNAGGATLVEVTRPTYINVNSVSTSINVDEI